MFRSRAKVTPATTLTYAVAGDSITAWPGSWKDQLDDPSLNFAGGFAEDGATSAHVLAHTRPTPADVLVVMLGTNDVKFDVPFTELVDNIERIAATAGCKSTLLCLLPPSTHPRDNQPAHQRRRRQPAPARPRRSSRLDRRRPLRVRACFDQRLGWRSV